MRDEVVSTSELLAHDPASLLAALPRRDARANDESAILPRQVARLRQKILAASCSSCSSAQSSIITDHSNAYYPLPLAARSPRRSWLSQPECTPSRAQAHLATKPQPTLPPSLTSCEDTAVPTSAPSDARPPSRLAQSMLSLTVSSSSRTMSFLRRATRSRVLEMAIISWRRAPTSRIYACGSSTS